MKDIVQWLQGKKAYLLAGLGALTLLINFLSTGDFSTQAVMDFLNQLFVGPGGLSALRAGISKVKPS